MIVMVKSVNVKDGLSIMVFVLNFGVIFGVYVVLIEKGMEV